MGGGRPLRRRPGRAGATVIAPALAAGQDVVCDRYLDSSLAYQGIARGLGVERGPHAEPQRHRGPASRPDLRRAGRSRGRCAKRSTGSDRIEREGLELQRKVDAAYRELASMFPNRITTVDGNRPPEVIAEEIRERLRELS